MAQTVTRGPTTTAQRDAALKRDEIRRKVYRQEPAEGSPTVKILKQLQRTKMATPRREFSWYRRPYDPRYGEVIDVYTDALATEYTTGGAVGDSVYVTMVADKAKRLVVGEVLFFGSDASPGEFVAGQIESINIGSDTTTWAVVKLLEADSDDMLAKTDLKFYVGGNAHEDLSGLPSMVRVEPIETSNIVQLFLKACGVSGTELAEQNAGAEVLDTTGFTEDQRRIRRELMEEIEWSILFGRYLKTTGKNGHPLHFMRGLVPAITTDQSDNVFDYKTDTDFTGQAWSIGGWPFLKNVMDQISQYGNADTYTMWVGDLALRGINDAIEGMGNFEFEPLENEFGIRVRRLHGMQCDLDIKRHPIFSTRPNLRTCGLIWLPRLVSYIPMRGRDIQVIGSEMIDQQRREGHTWIDGHIEGLLAQVSIRYDGLENMAFVKNIGEDSPSS